MTTDKAMVTDSPMQFFSENVDSWGAAEWFDRLAKAVRSQDEVCGLMHRAPKEDKWSYEASFETYRNIASSSALRLVRDYEHQIRAALAQAGQPVAVKPLKWNEGDGISCDRLYHTAETPFGLVYWQIERQWGTQGGYIEAYGEAETDQAAKAAAQSDYERRVLSALSTSSTPADGEDRAAPQSNTVGEPRCGVVGWPPLKKAIWDQVIAANLNGAKYISAWDLTDRIYAAAAATTEGQP